MLLSMLKRGCRVGFFGFGKSTASLISHLPLEKCHVTLRDDRVIDRNALSGSVKIDRICDGRNAITDIDEEIIFFSPSVRRERAELRRAQDRGVVFSSDAELFFSLNRRPVIAITGSDGKSTTATLTHMILKEAGYKSELIGNIGEPMVARLNSDADYFVCELSSFMLRYFTPTTVAACITNITPNHLDWHRDFNEYRETKLSLLGLTKQSVLTDEFDTAEVLVSRDKGYKELSGSKRANVFLTVERDSICKNGREIISLSEASISGHNITNLMLAIGLTDGLVNDNAICSAVNNFSPLPHRCEHFLRWNGIDFYNSSVDSTPSRTIATLKSLGRRVVIILGGRGKGLDYSDLIVPLKKYADGVIITGENADEIYATIGSNVNAKIIDDFHQAVIQGAEAAKHVGTLLLSPSSTSYDKFKNFAERGDVFKQICSDLSRYDNISLHK